MATHKALGRGLNALFSSQSEIKRSHENPPVPVPQAGDHIRDIAIHKIQPNRHQPRTNFDTAALEELAESIRSHGVAQPLIVTESGVAGQFELVVGERRLRAAKLAGLDSVPCIIRRFSNQKRFEVALIENLQREDLNSLDEAVALDGLMKEYGLTQEQVSKAIGKSRSAVANTLRFLRLHMDVQTALRGGGLTEGHAKILAGLTDHADQLRFLEKIRNQKWSVRDLESAVSGRMTARKKKSAASSAARSPEIQKYEEEIQRQLGRRVEIQSSGKKGWIRFAFYSPWDLEMLLKKLQLHSGDEGAAG